MYLSLIGDRQLTRKRKEELKKERGYKSAKTGKKHSAKDLEVDHKKPIALHKPSWWNNMPKIQTFTREGTKRLQSYDKKSNLQLLHATKEHRGKGGKSKTAEDMKKIKKHKKKHFSDWGLDF